MSRLPFVFLHLLLLFAFAHPAPAGANADFFNDVRYGMTREDLLDLGASVNGENARMQTVIGQKTWDGLYFLQNGTLSVVFLKGAEEFGPSLDAALRDHALLPVYLEIDGNVFELAARLRNGDSAVEAMNALVAFLHEAGNAKRLRTGYAGEATLATLVKTGLSFLETRTADPQAKLVITEGRGDRLRMLVCPAKDLSDFLPLFDETGD